MRLRPVHSGLSLRVALPIQDGKWLLNCDVMCALVAQEPRLILGVERTIEESVSFGAARYHRIP
jgi:hypothetical protein